MTKSTNKIIRFTPEQEVAILKLFVETNSTKFVANWMGVKTHTISRVLTRHFNYKKEIRELAQTPIEEWKHHYRIPERQPRKRGPYKPKLRKDSYQQFGVFGVD